MREGRGEGGEKHEYGRRGGGGDLQVNLTWLHVV